MPPGLKDCFRQFTRNDRWGTCVDCPQDSDGHLFPEFCINTNRPDHQLSIDHLVDQYKGQHA